MPVLEFQWVRLSDALTALGARLYDPTFQMWTQGELTIYIQEALQIWNCLTSQWRNEMVFTPSLNQWYPLDQLAGSIRAFTVTDLALVQEIEYHLQEPLSTGIPFGPWLGTGQFNAQQIEGAIQKRLNEVLGLSNCSVSQSYVDATVNRRTYLSDSTINVVRVAWHPAPENGQINVPLRQTDVWAKRAFDSGWLQAGQARPRAWMQSTVPAPGFDVDRVPNVPGRYDVLSTNGQMLSGTMPSVLSVPTDWAWVVKFGALLDLMGHESNAHDPIREEYCGKRYNGGLKLLSLASSVLEARVLEVPAGVGSVREGDAFKPRWQQGTGKPKRIYTAGLNLVALAPAPDSDTNYSIALTLVENAPIPQVPTDYIQINKEDLVTVLDYAQHLALFKIGGQEFLDSVPMWQRFMGRAALISSKLNEMGEFQQTIYDLAQLELSEDAQQSAEVLSAQ